MTSQALYRKWRPRTFDEVVGQEHVTRTLRNALASGRIVHAYLFSGPRGTGKTSTARILAKAVNCLAPEGVERPDNTCALCRSIDEGRCMDLIEMDAATHTGVEDVRDLLERIHFAPSEARYKVYIIDEVHRASANAFDALLKTLEEPPPHTLFVLATTEIHKVPPTILSRCQRFDFRPIPTRRIVEHLRSLVEAEHLEAEPEALELMARQATGSVRDAVSLLDQVASYGERRISLAQVQAILGTVAPEVVERLVQGLAQGDVSQGLTLIQEAIAEGADPRQLAREVVEYLRGVLLVKSAGRSPGHVAEETSAQMARFGGEFSTQRLAAGIRAFSRASWDFKSALSSSLPLEMAFVESVLYESEEAEAPAASGPARATPTKAAGGAPRRSPPSRRTREGNPGPSVPGEAEPSSRYSTGATSNPGEAEHDPAALQELLDRWEELLAAVKTRSMHVEALLKSCHPLWVGGDQIMLGFYYPFHKGKIEEARNRELLADVLAEVLGRRYLVRCELVSERPAARATAPTSQSSPREEGLPPENSGRAERPSAALEDDPLVRAALKMGGQIADVQASPPSEGQ